MSGGAAVVGVLHAKARSRGPFQRGPSTGYALLSRSEVIEEEAEDEENGDVEDVQQLEERLVQLRSRENQVKVEMLRIESRLMETQKHWASKREILAKESETMSEEIAEIEDKLQILRFPDMFAQVHAPPGPKCLSFVRSQAFLMASACIIFANIYTMVMEQMHPSYKRDTFILDQLYLAFYVVELSLKALYFREQLLCGKFADSCWNWLDLLIVVTGLLDQWAEPLLMHFGMLPASVMKSAWATGVTRLLRLARLPRILKIVQVFIRSDFSWASGDRFQLFMMSVIAFNCIVMSFEADNPGFVLWPYVENMLMAIFLFELIVRLRIAGSHFFCGPEELMWNWLDFIIVAGGVVETWLMPCIGIVQALLGMEPTESRFGQVLIMLRMARLLRILRLVRLIKNIPPLFTLLVGIVQAMYGMIWVLVLTGVLLYTAALLCVKLIGQGLIENVPDDVAVVFPSVPQSMFVLFMAMNGNAEMLTPVFHTFPFSKFVFVIYMVVLSWGILSILTAVVSENMINATEAHREELEALERERLCQNSQDWLSEIFDKTDIDGTGLVERQEFDDMMKDEFLVEELCSASGNLRKVDLVALFDCLSSVQDDNLIIRRKDFVQGLMTHSQAPPVTQRDILRLEKRMLMQERFLLSMMECFDTGATRSQKGNAEGMRPPSAAAMQQKRTEVIKSLAEDDHSPPICATPSGSKVARHRAAFEASVASVSGEEFEHRTSDEFEVARTSSNVMGARKSDGSRSVTPRTPLQSRPRPTTFQVESDEMAAPSAPGSSAAGSAVAPPQPQVVQAVQQSIDVFHDIRWVAGQVQALNAKFLSFQRNQDEALLMMRKVQGYLLMRSTNEKVAERAKEVCANRKSAVLTAGCGRSARAVSVRRRPPMPVMPREPE